MNIAVIDIGSPSENNIGWAIVGTHERIGRNLDACIRALAEALRAKMLPLSVSVATILP